MSVSTIPAAAAAHRRVLAGARQGRRPAAAGFRRPACAALLLGALVVAGCEGGEIVFGPGATSRQAALHPGLYAYRAWSDDHQGVAWWGYVELTVPVDGRVGGAYRLPRQCSDANHLEVDCVGHVGGTLSRDGRVRFGFDEGWLSHEGSVNRHSEITGRWWSRILGYRDEGTFELLPY